MRIRAFLYCFMKADVLIVASYSQLDIRKHCIKCHPYWAGRLSALSDQRCRVKSIFKDHEPLIILSRSPVGWKTYGKRKEMFLHVSLVGYYFNCFFLIIPLFLFKDMVRKWLWKLWWNPKICLTYHQKDTCLMLLDNNIDIDIQN